jgi:hypothetical protein
MAAGPGAPDAANHGAPAPAGDPGTAQDAVCPGCGTARLTLTSGRIVCQGCGVIAAIRMPGPQGAPAASPGLAPRTRPGEAHRPGPAGRSGDPAGTPARTGRPGTCARCHEAPPGPASIFCPPCRTAIKNQQRGTGRSGEHDDESGADRAVALRQAARQYLDHGLLPVPAWGVTPGGQCCCPRGAGCKRPGKHPRSAHVGPGEHDYSWKPLACATPEEIEQRFADGGDFATGNLMLAIPQGMLVIDQDNDDGGHQAAAALAEQLGELPGTLGHHTPRGVHRIYRTPPGWTPRAWVGKDPRNPLPAGIDLRVPGQILMTPPSRVPADGLLARYGPVIGSQIADLPAAYVTAWTPPKQPARAPRPTMPVPAGKADAAAAYVHARLTGIVEDLAGREPGGRNTAIYTAALKIGSTLGAARSTQGAQNAAAAWSDEAAEDALLAAAERNGYVADHSTAAARSAIRSGLRNGLRSPRPLPDFSNRPTPQARELGRAPERTRPDTGEQARARPTAARKSPPASAQLGSASPARSAETSSRDGPMGTAFGTRDSVSATLRAAGFKPSTQGHGSPDGPEGFLLQQSPDGRIVIQHTAIGEPIGGMPPWDRADQMLDRYVRTLRSAGYDITRNGPGSLTVRGPSASPHAGHGAGQGDAEPENRTLADRTAIAANAAYRAGDFDRARWLTDRAAALDPTRADLWQRRRTQIDAKRILHQARAARAEGDQARTQQLIEDAARLDPRLTSLWDHDLPGLPGTRQEPAVREQAGLDDSLSRPTVEPARDRGTAAAPRWPDKSGLHRSHDAHGHRRMPQAAESGNTIAKPGASGPPADRQPRPGEQTQLDRVQETAVRAATPDWHDAVTERERRQWQPKVVAAQPELAAAAEPSGAEING